ncbi:MAG: aldehyde ferredoxin oxidoreductase family protein [Anaerolineales bacterium]|nr:aldehyde ferredoxin oxidoreductase family protein [Anaerolineales bacterium]
MAESISGKILIVDLKKRSTSIYILPESFYRQYLGGSGMAVRLLFDRTDETTDPLGPENVLAFTVGPLTGTIVPTTNRFTVAARSPLTGIWGEADCGGRWGGELKRAGWDGILIHGISERPVYLEIEDERVSIRDAENLWGKDTFEVDLPGQIVCIGQAGENLVPMAGIMHDREHGRAAGRCGLGAVMGSKKLKAIAVQGSGRIKPYDSKALAESVRAKIPQIQESTGGFRIHGTAGGLEHFEEIGNLPIKNWAQGSWEGASKITGARMTETILVKNYACAGCPIGCGRTIEVKEGPYSGVHGGGPEYETLGAFGSMCLIDDLPAIARLNELCNRYGLDVISTGSTVAFAMEAHERGLIQNGPEWGDAEAAIELVHQIAHNRGELGQLLSGGVRRAAKLLGRNAENFAVHVKGLELPMHEPRAYWSAGLGYATSERGACHLQGLPQIFERSLPALDFGYQEILPRDQAEEKGRLTAMSQNWMALFDSLKMCKFTIFGGVRLADMVEWTNLVTGWDLSTEEALKIGERIHNLKRLYNLRLGISVEDDTLPSRILVRRRGEGGAADLLPPLGRMLADYYMYRGWTPEGKPRIAKLDQLGLEREGVLLGLNE